MFRKPREQSTTTSGSPLRPSTGRPPTPPSAGLKSTASSAIKNVTVMSNRALPVLGSSQTTVRSSGLNRNNVAGKPKGKPNGSILSFFKKVESTQRSSDIVTEEESSLFFEDVKAPRERHTPTQTPTPPRDAGDIFLDESTTRYNEDTFPSKRRRTNEVARTVSEDIEHHQIVFPSQNNPDRMRRCVTEVVSPELTRRVSSLDPATEDTPGENTEDQSMRLEGLRHEAEVGPRSSTGPFVEDSESEDEMIKHLTKTAFSGTTTPSELMVGGQLPMEVVEHASEEYSIPVLPTLNPDATSIVGGDGFDGMDDFIDDEFPADGEEYMERVWMDEQEGLEFGLEENKTDQDLLDMKDKLINDTAIASAESLDTEACPICSLSLAGVPSEAASVHVNNCLDGRPTPLPLSNISIKKEENNINGLAPSSHKRFLRAAIARPGQSNPFTFTSPEVSHSSAFSKLMSSHAEDAAWATAAAAETASRGKPAFQRICPFYKILPGFFTCVDAFRYGAVEGCNAYFLSHFHSDHYIGLTSSWCYGPIYCSHVTANLVRRQLRVDPKWVVDLEFDSKFEIPGTQGVEVTMIPANHCPGSSLYLFEKSIGKGKSPKVQRVLHCGDFRACPAHVQHPLLRPEVVDVVTSKNVGQQKLDVCYLDTTYLTPKYAFPSQEEVIKACADMCVSLSKDKVDETDDWEQTKKERAGSGMVKFVRKESETVKEELCEDDVDAMKVNMKAGSKVRGRLLVIVGTYSIGKERICLGVAKALDSKIYAPPNKQKICAALEDPELMARLTNDPLEAQVHMQMLMEIRAETLADYLTGYKPHFSRIVGFRPSGWNYRPPNSRFVESPAVQTVLYSDNWKSRYSMAELVPQRGSTREASCFGVPYSEHSSFRELTMFCCALRIDKIIPTVNVGSAKSREKMKSWCEKWAMEKKKNGLFKVADGQTAW
ncbi:hypothetical protein MMC26_000178 [Xylographa opegraphella]|nr:hypothetical protein [Xylographa opegraphella]